MRRSASILALTVAALASVATEQGLPMGDATTIEVFSIDLVAPEPVVLELEAGWSEDARRRAEITEGFVAFNLAVPEGVTATASSENPDETVSAEGAWLEAWFRTTCDTESCTGRAQVDFEGPAELGTIEVEVQGYGRVTLTERRDEEDIEIELTLTGPGVP
jgi:hypothetical protein